MSFYFDVATINNSYSDSLILASPLQNPCNEFRVTMITMEILYYSLQTRIYNYLVDKANKNISFTNCLY